MTDTLRPLLVGIGGGSGGGKTLLANLLCEWLGRDQTVVLGLDSYYRNQSDMPVWVRGNFDHPESIDQQLFFDHLQQLSKGLAVDVPGYDFPTHTRVAQTSLLSVKPFIIIDGVLLYALEGVFDFLDLSIFVDTACDVRLARRLYRDVRERGRTMDSVLDQYLSTVRPMHNRYVEPYKQRVDKIVSGEIAFEESLPDLVKQIRSLQPEVAGAIAARV